VAEVRIPATVWMTEKVAVGARDELEKNVLEFV
jgi:hypothetical protein